MPDNSNKVRIAVNVMRARLTVIGFNIAIVSFQISQLYKMSGGVSIPGVDHLVHLRASTALFMALSLSLLSMMAYIMSCAHDEVGICDHRSFLAGDLLMYFAVAYTVTGFFAPIHESLNIASSHIPDQIHQQIAVLQKTLWYFGAIAWFSAMYVGPIVSLLRSPFSRRINIGFGTVYVGVLLIFCWVNSQTFVFEVSPSGKSAIVPVHFLIELVQPFRW